MNFFSQAEAAITVPRAISDCEYPQTFMFPIGAIFLSCHHIHINFIDRILDFFILTGKLTEELSRTAKGAAESLSDTSQKLGQTSAFKTFSQVAILFLS